jgi:hypothetical protein
MSLDNMSRDDWIVGGLAVLLAIFLLVLPWFTISDPFNSSISVSFSATSQFDGWLAIIAFIVLLALIADLAIERLSPQTKVPVIGGSRVTTRFFLAAVAAGLLALKFLFHIHFGYFGWGFYVDIIVAAVLVFAAFRVSRGEPALPVGAAR